MRANHLVIGLFVLLWLPHSLVDAQTGPLDPDPPLPAADAPSEGIVDRTHSSISSGVEAFLSRADALFAGSESYDAPTGSYIRLGSNYTFLRARHDGNKSFTFIRAKVRLPRTNDRLQIIVDRGLEAVTRSESQTEAERVTGQNTTDDDFFVGLRAVAAEKLDITLTSDAGLRFRGFKADPFVRGRAQRVFTPGLWSIPLSETLLWRRLEGASAASELAFLREVSPSTVLSFTSNATYRFEEGRFDLSQVATLAKRLDDRSLLLFEAGAFGHTEPGTEVTSYTLATRYRQRLWRDWLLMEIRPQLTFPRERDFDMVPSLTFGLEAYFGKGKLPEP